MARHFLKGEVRRRQIAKAALEVIAAGGLDSFTVRAIAAKLPITDGTIFRHFRNKQEIVLAAMDLLEEDLFTPQFVEEPDPLIRLQIFFRERARLLGGPLAVGRLVFSEELAQAAGEEGFERVREWRRKSGEMVTGCLGELVTSGRLRTDLTVRQLVRVVLGVMLTFSNERLLLQATNPLDERVEDAWATLEKLLFSETSP